MSQTRIAFLERQNEILKQEVLGHCDAIDQLAVALNDANARISEFEADVIVKPKGRSRAKASSAPDALN